MVCQMPNSGSECFPCQMLTSPFINQGIQGHLPQSLMQPWTPKERSLRMVAKESELPSMNLSNQEGLAVGFPWAPAKTVDGCVVHKVPDEDADDAILALVYFCSFDDLLLDGCREPPVDHVARVLVLVRGQDEASIVRSQAGCKHASTPWPPSPM